MRDAMLVLVKTLVYTFYRRNALGLGVVFFLAAGFLRAGDHIALATAAVTSPLVLAGYLLLWAGYTALATASAFGSIRTYDVLLHWRLFPATKRLWAMVRVQVLLLQPVLVYALFVAWVGWQERQFWAVGVISVAGLAGLAGGLLAYEYALRNPHPPGLWARWTAQVRWRGTTPFGLFWFRDVWANDWLMLLRTKAATCFLWLGVLALYRLDHAPNAYGRTPDYDLRLLGLGTLLLGLGHAALVYRHYQFEQRWLALYRNLPVSTLSRWGRGLGQFAGLLLPELLLLLRNLPPDLTVWQSVSSWIFGLSLLAVVQALLLRTHRPLEQLMPVVFWLLVGYFLLVMYHVPLWLLAGLNLTLSGSLFARVYWQSAPTNPVPD